MKGRKSERNGRKWDEGRGKAKEGRKEREFWPLPYKILIRHQA